MALLDYGMQQFSEFPKLAISKGGPQNSATARSDNRVDST